MFHKINLLLNQIDVAHLKGELREQYGPSNAKFVAYNISNFSYFINLHPAGFKFKIKPDFVYYVEITGEGVVLPHIDPNIKCALNYYIESSSCTTAFHTLKSNYTELYAQQELNVNVNPTLRAIAYRMSDVDTIGEFTANNNEAYLISTASIHSVTKPDNRIRKFISYRWKTNSYNDVLQSLI